MVRFNKMLNRALLLRGGRVVDPAIDRNKMADVLAVDGRISAIGPGLVAPEGAEVRDVRTALTSLYTR